MALGLKYKNAEPFATGVLSFLIDITKRQVEMNDIYSWTKWI